MKNVGNVRFWLAAAVAPALPLSFQIGASPAGAWPLIFGLGYLYAFLIAFPIMATVVSKRALASCLGAGGLATTLPFILVGVIALLAGEQLTRDMLMVLCELFAVGACGGALFWAIAFWGVPAAPAHKA